LLGIGYSAFGIARHSWSFIEGTDTTGVALTGFTF
jgi:hypothetical protein